jgi:virginiamycin B lyase
MKGLSVLILVCLIFCAPFMSIQGQNGQTAVASYTRSSLSKTSSYTIEEYAIPTAACQPESIDEDSSGLVWFNEVGTSMIAAFNRTATSFVEYATSDFITIPSYYSRSLRVDSNDSIWFLAFDPNKIIRYDSSSGVSTEFAVPSAESGPFGIAVDREGNVWFTEVFGNKVGRIFPDGNVTEYDVPTPFAGPSGICASPDGSVWFTEDGLSLPLSGVHKIAKLDPDSGEITEYSTPTASPTGMANLVNIVCDSQGNVWFTEASSNKIGEFAVSDGEFKEYDLPSLNGYPWGIDVDESDNVWFTENGGNKIGRLSWNRIFKEFLVPTASAGPMGIVCTKGAVWFTEERGNKIGRLEVAKNGDLDYDGIVTIFDAIIASRAFGSSPGKPEWNSGADLNENNAIDIFDLIIIASNFGKRF